MPLVIAGMHRSGTSLTASYVASLGIDIGSDLVPADANNRRGYFEDTRFLDINREMLTAATDAAEEGHHDWGWTESEILDRHSFEAYYDRAVDLVASLESTAPVWGFKDPRSSLALDFWDTVLPDARFLLVYRMPWDVADSMQRLGAEVFLNEPEWAYRIWTFYNRHLLDFYRRNSDRCVLASTDMVLRSDGALSALLQDKLGLPVSTQASQDEGLRALFEKGLMTSLPAGDPLPRFIAATSPACVSTLAELDAMADIPSTGCWTPPTEPLTAPEIPGDLQTSVVIPCRNHGQLLLEALASVERHLDEAYEVVIVNDGSDQERTLVVLAVLRQAGYLVIDLDPAGGLPTARNAGFAAARGRAVLPLDADNRLRAGFVERGLEVLATSTKIGVVYGHRNEFGQRAGVCEVREFDLDALLTENYIDACALMRRDMWWDLGGYDPELCAWEDWELWIRAARRGWQFERLDQVTFDYRVRPGSLVSATVNTQVLGDIMVHVVGTHHEIFHPFLQRKAGHKVAGWAIHLANQLGTVDETQGMDAQLKRMRDKLPRIDIEAIDHLERHNKILKGHNVELQATLDEIHESRGWRMLKWLWSVSGSMRSVLGIGKTPEIATAARSRQAKDGVVG